MPIVKKKVAARSAQPPSAKLPSATIRIRTAIKKIAPLAHPNLNPETAEARIRADFHYAQQQKRLPYSDPIPLSALKDWLTGSRHPKKWPVPKIIKALALPGRTVTEAVCEKPRLRGKVVADVVPGDPNELAHSYRALIRENRKLHAEIADFRSRLQSAEAELQIFREKQQDISAKRRTANHARRLKGSERT